MEPTLWTTLKGPCHLERILLYYWVRAPELSLPPETLSLLPFYYNILSVALGSFLSYPEISAVLILSTLLIPRPGLALVCLLVLSPTILHRLTG